MKTIVLKKQQAVAAAADQLVKLLAEKPNATLAFAAGETMRPFFAELVERYQKGMLRLADCRLFSVAEYTEVPETLSCAYMLRTELVEKTDLRMEACCFLTEETLEDYDQLLVEAGGLDVAVLGLGINGHIGFNEPATPFASRCHRQKLTNATRRQKAAVFGSEDAVPECGLTMGIKTLTEAREILLLAFGEKKAEAVFQMLYGRNDSTVPAAFLQIPSRVTIYLDQEASAKL